MASSLDKQVAGDHYQQGGIQHVEWVHSNGLGYIEGNITKYIARHRRKNGLEDLKKAKHYLEILMELEYGINS